MSDLSLKEVTKRFDGGVTAVDAVSFSVSSGEFVVLIGASGSGKTTCLRMINRLIEPTSGTIEIGGEAVTDLPAHELRRRIGYVVQGIGLFPHMTVAENIGITPRLLGWAPEEIAARVDELLGLVHLPPGEYRGRRPDELSGGQRQRVGFARALAARPAALLLDEPFGALDPVTRADVQREFLSIQRDLGQTAVMVSHDMMEALAMADRILVLNKGRLIRDAAPADLWRDPGDDYTAALMAQPREQAERLAALSAQGAASEGAPA